MENNTYHYLLSLTQERRYYPSSLDFRPEETHSCNEAELVMTYRCEYNFRKSCFNRLPKFDNINFNPGDELPYM